MTAPSHFIPAPRFQRPQPHRCAAMVYFGVDREATARRDHAGFRIALTLEPPI